MLDPIMYKVTHSFREVDTEENPEGFSYLLTVVDNLTGESRVVVGKTSTNKFIEPTKFMNVPALLWSLACLASHFQNFVADNFKE